MTICYVYHLCRGSLKKIKFLPKNIFAAVNKTMLFTSLTLYVNSISATTIKCGCVVPETNPNPAS